MTAPFTFGSVCSGMEAASLAWGPLGWKCALVSEIDKAPSALLAQRYPDVPNFGDMTKFEDWPDVAIDLLAGGTPCQSFSVAGLRKGLTDPRGSLMLTYGAIAQRYRPAWLFWENVPGVLSSNGGRDFGAFLGMLAELGYGFAHRVLDAQFFGLAQRRKRVFVVGRLGDWRAPAAVLFERESLRGDSPPSREAGEGVAGTIAAGAHPSGFNGRDAERGNIVLANTLLGKENPSHAADLETYVTHALRGEGFDASEDGTGRGTPLVAFNNTGQGWWNESEVASPIRTPEGSGSLESTVVAYNITPSQSNKDYNARPTQRAQAVTTADNRPSARGGDVIAFDARQSDVIQYGDMSGPIDTDQQSIGVLAQWAVRRLTPRECERLQGAPDDYTLVTYRGKPMADGPRYKMIGNSWAVPVVRWIGERIAEVHGLKAALHDGVSTDE